VIRVAVEVAPRAYEVRVGAGLLAARHEAEDQVDQPVRIARNGLERGIGPLRQRPVPDEPDAPGPFADQRTAVGQKDEGPRRLQPIDPGLDAVPGRVGNIRFRPCLRFRTDDRVRRRAGGGSPQGDDQDQRHKRPHAPAYVTTTLCHHIAARRR